MVSIIFGTLAFLSVAINLWQFIAARCFPLHRRSSKTDFTPGLSLLKPLKGADAETEGCLATWFVQDYPGPLQLLFAVVDENDPVVPIVRKLMALHPKVDAELVLCTEKLGINSKVSKLIQASRKLRHDYVVVSDADVAAPPDFLLQTVQAHRDSKVGLVNCFYILANPSTLAMRWEAIAVNSDFWSQVLQSRTIKPLDFALGAVMTMRREALEKIGGFAVFKDHLADDYQLGHRIKKAGYQIELSKLVVECRENPKGWRAIWTHQVRWSRTIRVCQPVPFFLSILSNATLWPVLFSAALLAGHHLFWFVPVSIFLPVRIQAALKMQEWLTRDLRHYAWFWLVPIKDLLNAAIWLLAFAGNTIEWRGEEFRILSDGKLRKIQR